MTAYAILDTISPPNVEVYRSAVFPNALTKDTANSVDASDRISAQTHVSLNGSDFGWFKLNHLVASWKSVPHNWDGMGGTGPGPAVMNVAFRFMEMARIASVPVPEPYFSGDGEIGFRWEKDDGFASVAILPELHIVAYARPAGGNYPVEIDEPFFWFLDKPKGVLDLTSALRTFA